MNTSAELSARHIDRIAQPWFGAEADPPRSPALWLGGSRGEFHRFAVRRAAVGFGPRFFASEKRRGIGQALRVEQALQSRQPVVVVVRAIVGLNAASGGLEFV